MAITQNNYDKPLILTPGSRGLSSTAETSATGFGTALTDDYVLGTGGNDILSGGVATFVFTGTDGNDTDGIDTAEGGAGDDQYVVNDTADVVVEVLGEGNNDTVFTAVSYKLSDNVENIVAEGTVAITITGNKAANILDGSATTGVSDTLIGLEGDDIYIVGGTTTRDKVKEAASGGIDTIVMFGATTANVDISKDSVQIVGAVNFENVILTDAATGLNITGNGLANRLVGNGGINLITGNDGNDTLDGGYETTTAINNDILVGGRGNDTYIVINSDDVINEFSNACTDTFRSYTSYKIICTLATTGANLENITLLGATAADAKGNAAVNILIGNSAANSLDGGANNDTLTGNQGADTIDGGAGNDSLAGGLGDDIYVVSSASDKVLETSDHTLVGGVDTVVSAVSYTLGANVEKLTLGTWVASVAVSTSTTDAINAIGNSLDNTIIGNDSDNKINGGVGDDTVTAGAGDDTITVDSNDDKVDGGAGSDTINSSVTFNLLTGASGGGTTSVEILTLTGTDAVDVTGNVLDNTLKGNDFDNSIAGGDGADTLYGDTSSSGTKGGADTLTGDAGIDKLYGYGGNDSLNGGAAADVVYGGEGNDIIKDDTGVSIGTDADALNGEKGDDSLTASGGIDTLSGGDGDDVLTAGSAANSLSGGAGNDKITGSTSTTAVAFVTSTAIPLLSGSYTDTIDGGAGHDVITAAAGTDGILGGEGNDTITGGLDADTVATGKGNDTVVFASSGTTPNFVSTDTVAAAASSAGVDKFTDLSLTAATGDVIDLSVVVATVGSAVSGAVADGNFVANMSTLLAASGVGFDTSKTGDISAAVVITNDATPIKYLAVDLNANNVFDSTDFVINITGSTYASMTTASFV